MQWPRCVAATRTHGGVTTCLHKLRSRAQDEKGFTLIELLVVVLSSVSWLRSPSRRSLVRRRALRTRTRSRCFVTLRSRWSRTTPTTRLFDDGLRRMATAELVWSSRTSLGRLLVVTAAVLRRATRLMSRSTTRLRRRASTATSSRRRARRTRSSATFVTRSAKTFKCKGTTVAGAFRLRPRCTRAARGVRRHLVAPAGTASVNPWARFGGPKSFNPQDSEVRCR